MRRLCSFFMIAVSFFALPVSAEPSAVEIQPSSAAGILLDNFVNGRSAYATSFFNLYFKETQNPFDRHEVLRHLISDPSWKWVSADSRLMIYRKMLEEGPLTARLERELAFLISRLRTVEAMAFLFQYVRTNNMVTFYDDGFYPRLISPLRQKVWRHTLGGELLAGETLLRRGEVDAVISKWAQKQFPRREAVLSQIERTDSVPVRDLLTYVFAGGYCEARLHD